MTLSTAHRDYLLAAAITPEVIDASGIHTREKEPTGIVFPWNDGSLEEALPQLRPDTPALDEKGRPIKYRFPAGAKMILNRLRDLGEGPALIVEGTKQQYSALSYAPADYSVFGLSGCWSWTDADLSWAMDREVYVLFDGDITGNADVHKAATELAEQLDLSGAAAVRYVRTTARNKEGLDDVLAKLPHDKRAQYLGLWISKALAKLPKAPARKPENPLFDKQTGFLVDKATRQLLEEQPAALTAERKVALYMNGAYHIDGTAFLSAVGRMLGDQFRPAWRSAMEERTVGLLFEEGRILPERSPFSKLNCTNGMLDLHTLELTDHSPEFMSTVQVNVAWDPAAQAPVYERWLDMVTTQAEDLEEVCGTMLDPTRTPHKAVFLFGPSRSGKSTLLRLLQAIAGESNRTAVTLHDLSRDRFAAANVYGKILNSAADLSAAHVDDLSVFKMMTGEDPIHGNRKYGTQFTFTNQALFAFSANELPTVSESSRAYAERIKPFEFPWSFAGKEDPSLEAAMLGRELPGILVRWVHAYRRVLARGGYQETDLRVRREFETRSDRVAQWVSDVCVVTEASPGQNLPDHQCTGRRESARAFNQWAERNGGHKMGERKIFDRLGQIRGVVEVRAGRSRQRAFNIVVKDDPNADLGLSPQPPRERADVRAVRAVSEHPSHTPFTPPSNHPREKDLEMKGQEPDVEVHGKGVSKLPVQPVTARPSRCPNCGGQGCPMCDIDRPAPVALGFDLETASAQELFTGKHEGPFVRLAGVVYTDDYPLESGIEASVTYPPSPFRSTLEQLNNANVIYGHNVLGFDLLALARHHGADYDKLAAKAVDTLVLAQLIDPPLSKGMPEGYYTLDGVAERLGLPGKTDDLKGLAKEYGGYDRIPLDSRRYQDYLRGDLAASKAVYEDLRARVAEGSGAQVAYAEREMKVVALQNRMTLNGWAVDTELLAERVAHEDAQRAQAVETLHGTYGMPLARPDRYKLKTKAEAPGDGWAGLNQAEARALLAEDPEKCVRFGIAVRVPGEPYASPWATDGGREALVRALADKGVTTYPTTPSGDLALSSDALGERNWYCAKRAKAFPGLLQIHGDKPGVKELVETICQATGARVKYAEIARYVTAQGRVHAGVGAAQGSGRWAMTKPSITNMGKRGAAAAERGVLVADEGHLLLTCDHSQLDVRTVAALSGDPELIAMLMPDADDYHEVMAEIYFGDRSRRSDGKPISHGVNYGQGAKAIAARNGLDVDMVAQALAARGDKFARLMEWTQEVRQRAERGELLDNGFGRLMRPDPGRAYTQAPALMGQGAARDVMCESLLRLVKARPDVTPLLRAVVHDEVVLSVPADTVDEWTEELRRAMTWEWRGVPILCEVSKPAFRWSDCK